MRTRHRTDGRCRSGFGEGTVSLAGRAFFKSHRHKGQRVATEYTMWPKALHSVLAQARIATSNIPQILRLVFRSNRKLKTQH